MKKISFVLSMILLFTAGAAFASNVYWTKPGGTQVWTNGKGECWGGSGSGPDASSGMCDGKAPAPEPEMMAAPPSLDDDGDGVPNSEDICWTTPAGDKVDLYGCTINEEPIVSLRGVHFATDSAALTSEAKSILDSAVGAINASSSSLIDVEGHTDNTGSDSHNQSLSERRAQSVADYLASQGVSASSLNPIGMGEGSPVASNDTRDGRRLNRRVDVTIR